ncbi:ATP-grasp domain-containing protein [Enterococcus larvae]|uniref:ATP-grasp domain-containing protein n=1 Tax=Enterococcus larvae TaxID=2794352 RepID=UPI003F333085
MNRTMLVFLFPADPIDPKRVDFDYEKEYAAARIYCDVGLLQLEQLIESNIVKIDHLFPKGMTIIYRGWMLTPKQYSTLQHWAEEHGFRLCISLEEYTNTHLLPNWSNRPNTLHSEWTEDLSQSALSRLLSRFNSAVTIKDFVKSRKHEWAEAFFIPDSSDITHAMNVIHTFIERQGEQLVGGVVLREFIDLKEIGHHPKSDSPIFEEYRVFYWQTQPILIIDYWNNETVSLKQQELDFIAEQAHGIASPFFTIDYARKTNEELVIMEMGDGQVSGLQEYDEEIFYEKLIDALEKES